MTTGSVTKNRLGIVELKSKTQTAFEVRIESYNCVEKLMVQYDIIIVCEFLFVNR